MTDSSFFSANLLALGGQLAQTWQKMLDAWWQGLLGDRDRLRDLAAGLAGVAPEANAGGRGAASAEDLAKVVKALELIERRQKVLEDQVKALTDNLGAVVAFLEKAGPGPRTPGGEGERP